MADIIQFRRGTAATATSNNVTLADGEVGIETDTLKIKIGDGVTAWNSLAYYKNPESEDAFTTSLVTIPFGDWSSNQITITVTGMTATADVEALPPSGVDADYLTWGSNDIRVLSRTTNSVTLKCTITPTTTYTDAQIIWRV